MAVGHVLRGAGILISKEFKNEIKEQAIAATVAGVAAAGTFLKDEDENEKKETEKELDASKDDVADESNEEEEKEKPSTEFQDKIDAEREKSKAINEETEHAEGRSIGDMDKIENADSILEGGNQLEGLIDKASEQQDKSPKSWREKILKERGESFDPDNLPDSQSFNEIENDELDFQSFAEKEKAYFGHSNEFTIDELDQLSTDSIASLATHDSYDLKFDVDFQRFREEYRQKEIELNEEPEFDFDLAYSEPPLEILNRPDDFDVTDASDNSDASDGAEGGEGGDGGGDGGSGGSGGAGGGAGGSG